MEIGNNGKLAQVLLEEAVKAGASDMHVEPLNREVRVRLRIDGLLQEMCRLPWSCYGTLLTQLKVQSGMDIAEKRVPQDGRLQLSFKNRAVDLRLASLPTIEGEKMAIRLLDQQQGLLPLEELGMSDANFSLYKNLCSTANGLVLITGPTGCGKTTALYATLQALQQEGLNLVTLEDPVEYKLSGINQVAINRKAGLGFANGLRSLVRQDPDIIMVGEIRDAETAAMAVQAALTGHLVFSTLHTNSAAGAITRLEDMGIAPYLVAAALKCVVAQRLVRRVCEHCAVQYLAGASEKAYLGAAPEKDLLLRQGSGCEHCRGTGYTGRLAIQEVLPIDEHMAELISASAGRAELLRYGRRLGWRSLYEDGVNKVLRGATSISELWRVGIAKDDYRLETDLAGEVLYVH